MSVPPLGKRPTETYPSANNNADAKRRKVYEIVEERMKEMVRTGAAPKERWREEINIEPMHKEARARMSRFLGINLTGRSIITEEEAMKEIDPILFSRLDTLEKQKDNKEPAKALLAELMDVDPKTDKKVLNSMRWDFLHLEQERDRAERRGRPRSDYSTQLYLYALQELKDLMNDGYRFHPTNVVLQ